MKRAYIRASQKEEPGPRPVQARVAAGPIPTGYQSNVHALQRVLGNRAVGRLLRAEVIQARLRVAPAKDRVIQRQQLDEELTVSAPSAPELHEREDSQDRPEFGQQGASQPAAQTHGRYQPTDLDLETALTFLRDHGYLVDESVPLTWTAWNTRLRTARRQSEARATLPTQEAELAALRREESILERTLEPLQYSLERLTGELRTSRTRHRQLLRLKRQIRGRMRQLERRLRAYGARVPSTRRPDQLTFQMEYTRRGIDELRWRLEDLEPELESHERVVRAAPEYNRKIGELRTRIRPAQRALARLRSRIRRLTREVEEKHALVQPRPPEAVNNPDAVRVDLSSVGVAIKYQPHIGTGKAVRQLDPIFAVAVIRFLIDIRNTKGVTEVYHKGFLRRPMSPRDTHPQGRAWDIKGFKVGEHVLALRSGRMLDRSDPAFEARHSDWFDNHNRIPERGNITHEQMMREIAGVMSRYFGQIVGPGHNADHMDHFHVQLVGYRGPAGALLAPATRESPYPYQD